MSALLRFRLFAYLGLLVAVLWLGHLYVTQPLMFTKIPYRLHAFWLSYHVECDAGGENLESIISDFSLPYFSLTGEVAYVDADNNVSRCSISPASRQQNDAAPMRFRFASMTKAVTAFAILDLAKSGKLTLDDKLLAFFPEVDAAELRDKRVEQISVTHLLNHSSGLGGVYGSDDMVKENKKPWCPYTPRGIESVRLAGPPGQNYLYNNVDYCLLGEVVSRAAGVEFRDYIREKYLSAFASLNFVDGGFLPDEPDYDFSNEYRFDEGYVQWLDLFALSSAAGLMGEPKDLAKLLWKMNNRNPGAIFSAPMVQGCEKRYTGRCYSYAFELLQGKAEGGSVAVQRGYLPGASSLVAINEQGAVLVWVSAGAAVEKKYNKGLVEEVVSFMSNAL